MSLSQKWNECLSTMDEQFNSVVVSVPSSARSTTTTRSLRGHVYLGSSVIHVVSRATSTK